MDSASARAYKALHDGILDGTYPTEEMLGETSLATELGVSRTPVRAALARLQDEGWITIFPKRGALVRGLTDREVTDLAEARLILESSSVERTSPHSQLRLAEKLVLSIEEQRAAFQARDLKRFIELTLAFHRAFVEIGGNGVLLDLNDRLADRQRFLLFSYGEKLLARCAEIISEHEELVEQLRTGSSTAFAHTLHSHLASTYAAPLRETT